MLDGVDISERAFGNVFQTVIPTPPDAIEEFRGAHGPRRSNEPLNF